jgi:polyisoprenoid-binding protein YceI
LARKDARTTEGRSKEGRLVKRLALLCCAALFVSTAAFAKGPDKYIYDPAHTQIHFAVDHLGFSHPQGRFDKFHGGFTFDPSQPEKSQIDVTIDANSIDMASADWERMLKGASFFNTAKFPVMTFKSKKIEKTGDKTGKVTGDLTLLGVTKTVALDVTYNKSGVHPLNRNYLAGFSATGKIRRSDFGMTFGLPGIGDDVDIDIQVEGIRQDFEDIRK